ncbi:AP-1-like transcription factor CAP1 [Candida viswanathii]|uniref:AP-1-like transcription factor CAP1 n=1 Tax=Candida viswanathii TaxID=5486 RepID=A0A367XUQ2_9ASCO|nr:AP-1-like transcription factor CAP1 [Candida viswanathii]
MADVKRNFSDIASPANLDENKKIHTQTKVGRKPIETEPKSKRTAQNRAAQRAYRERKERKMKDLEDKVKLLEDANVKAVTETDFLKAQVDILKSELAKYRGGDSDFLDLNLPTKVGHLSNPNSGNYHHKSENTPMSSISSTNSVKSPDADKPSSASSVSNSSPGIAFDNPWSKDNLQKLKELQQQQRHNLGQQTQQQQQQQQAQLQGCPDLVLGSSSSTSPLNDNLLVTPESLASMSTGGKNGNAPMNFDFSKDFDEQVDPFCAQLNEACGTRKNPVPKYKRSNSRANTVTNSHASPFSNLVTPDANGNESVANAADYMNDPFFNSMASDYNFNFNDKKLSGQYQDPLSFLNDDNFDVSLAFEDPSPEQEQDPISLLTTEESIYDPIANSGLKTEDVNTNFNFNDFIKSSLPEKHNRLQAANKKPTTTNDDDDDDDNVVVPAPEQTLKCSEIWDRITAHPKYTEIDIDGLCQELKNKAKCSEKGVVINTADVNQLLEQSIKR